MNVYEVRGSGKYCSGMMIVVAESPDMAIKLANSAGSVAFNFYYQNVTHLSTLTTVDPLLKNVVLSKHEYGE